MSSDGVSEHVRAFSVSNSIFSLMADQHKLISDSININVLGPLTEFFTNADLRLRSLLQEEHKLSKEMASTRSVVIKHQKECLKLYEQLKFATSERERSSSVGGGDDDGPVSPASGEQSGVAAAGAKASRWFNKFKNKIAVVAAGDPKKLMETLAVSAKQYQDAVKTANARLQRYIEVDLPRVFDGLQELEVQRLKMSKKGLVRLHRIYYTAQSPMWTHVCNLATSTKNLDADENLASFVEDWLAMNGDPAPFHSIPYLLPCTPEDLKAGKLESNPKAVFKNSLDRIMSNQVHHVYLLGTKRSQIPSNDILFCIVSYRSFIVVVCVLHE